MIHSSFLFRDATLAPLDKVIITHEQRLLIDEHNPLGMYHYRDIVGLVNDECLYFPVHTQENERVYVVELNDHHPKYESVSLRSQLHLFSDDDYLLASRALQLVTWFKQHRYCGQCGQLNHKHPKELALNCERCEIVYYPRISPCMMCLITRGDECLLAHHHRQAEGMYSTLAGFVEAGESLEHTVHREVMEEVGLKVDNLRYFASQSWPFPHQLMVAYMVDYVSGDIRLQDEEIADARWFHYSELPMIPPSTTLSGRLIEAFVGSFS